MYREAMPHVYPGNRRKAKVNKGKGRGDLGVDLCLDRAIE